MRVGVFLRPRYHLPLFLRLFIIRAVLMLPVRFLHLILDGDCGHEAVLLRKVRLRDIRQQARDRLCVQLHRCQHFLTFYTLFSGYGARRTQKIV